MIVFSNDLIYRRNIALLLLIEKLWHNDVNIRCFTRSYRITRIQIVFWLKVPESVVA